MEWSRESTMKLIELLKNNEVLWNVSSDIYRDKLAKRHAVQNIAQQLNISELDAERKIQNLKCQYHREASKLKRFKNGMSYVSKWYGFELLQFLKGIKPPKSYTTETRKRSWIWEFYDELSSAKARCKICEAEISRDAQNTSGMIRHVERLHRTSLATETTQETPERQDETAVQIQIADPLAASNEEFNHMTFVLNEDAEISNSPDVPITSQRSKKPKLDAVYHSEDFGMFREASDHRYKKERDRDRVRDRDDCSVFGEFVANELRTTRGEINQLILKKKIQDAIYEVKFASLQQNAPSMSPPPPIIATSVKQQPPQSPENWM